MNADQTQDSQSNEAEGTDPDAAFIKRMTDLATQFAERKRKEEA